MYGEGGRIESSSNSGSLNSSPAIPIALPSRPSHVWERILIQALLVPRRVLSFTPYDPLIDRPKVLLGQLSGGARGIGFPTRGAPLATLSVGRLGRLHRLLPRRAHEEPGIGHWAACGRLSRAVATLDWTLNQTSVSHKSLQSKMTLLGSLALGSEKKDRRNKGNKK